MSLEKIAINIKYKSYPTNDPMLQKLKNELDVLLLPSDKDYKFKSEYNIIKKQ